MCSRPGFTGSSIAPSGPRGRTWWAHLVGALRVHPHKHYANYPPQKIEDVREAGAPR